MRFVQMKPAHTAIALSLCSMLTFGVQADSSISALARAFDGLEREMSEQERRAAGVDKLSPQQLEFLNTWLKERFVDPNREVQVNNVPQVTQGAVPSDVGETLTPEAEAAIAAEVERRIAAEVAAARQAREADEQAEQDNEPFEAVIRGNFTGWSGKTVFSLDNGQVWRQRHGSSYRHTGGEPRVRFEQNFFGLWEMTVLSSRRTIGVRRID